MTVTPVRPMAQDAFNTFEFSAPREERIAAPRPLPSHEVGEKFRVLVVEDDSHIARLILSNLARMGMECRYAPDGETALKAWRETNPHLVLLDLLMPGLDGYTICSMIRRESGLPIIVVTARDEIENQLHSFKIGADDYISKPFDIKVFVARVVALLRRTYRYNTCECTLSEAAARAKSKMQPGQNVPKGWAHCESCHYMGPSVAFDGRDNSDRPVRMCPHCRSTSHVAFAVG